MTKRTYISLFSSAGVGCYGFKMAGFDCVASNELLEPRLEIQRANNKCKYSTGYICGDATSKETHDRILSEIELWREKESLEQVDVVFATPPCQGMSTANYKKNDHEQIRNSLVVEAIKMVKLIKPKVFVFENVRAFLKSICTDISGKDTTIKESIINNLANDYNIYWKVINFKDYGVPSSRPRTLVIGTSKSLSTLSPLSLFPSRTEEIPLRTSIGGLTHLEFGEKDSKDPFHFARPFPEYMLPWIKDLKEGETAFNNPDETKPYSLDASGNRVINKGAYMGNKYRRLIWDKPGACIATRSDVMSSQDTIHPCDNRVLSIRELMILMTIPDEFRWTMNDFALTVDNSEEYLKDNEGNIRRCIGEAVPTKIGFEIARKISAALDYDDFLNSSDRPAKSNYYIKAVECGISLDEAKVFSVVKSLPDSLNRITARVASITDFLLFAPQVCSYYSQSDSISFDCIDFSKESVATLKSILKTISLGSRTEINFVNGKEKAKNYNLAIENHDCFPLTGGTQQLSLF